MDLTGIYRHLVETSPYGIWVLDLDGRSLYANAAIARLHGVTREALSTLTVSETRDQEGRSRLAARLAQVRAGAVSTTTSQLQWVRHDGATSWVTCRETVLTGTDGRAEALMQWYSEDADVVRDPEDDRVLGKRILVVEDNPVNQLVATGLLQQLGYRTEVAEDGLAAVVAVRDHHVDLILMDLQMPHMDGFTATRHIRAEEKGGRRPIIALTASAIKGDLERCLDAGMDDFLAKPVDSAELAEKLERWLEPAGYAGRLALDRLAELRGLDALGEGPSYVSRAIERFLAHAVDDLAAMNQALAVGDAEQLRAVAHRLAGAALNLGAVGLGQEARSVEEHARAGALAEAAAAMPALASTLNADVGALRAYHREHYPHPTGR